MSSRGPCRGGLRVVCGLIRVWEDALSRIGHVDYRTALCPHAHDIVHPAIVSASMHHGQQHAQPPRSAGHIPSLVPVRACIGFHLLGHLEEPSLQPVLALWLTGLSVSMFSTT